MPNTKKKTTARKPTAIRCKRVKVGLIQPWSNPNDKRNILDHISDLQRVMGQSSRYRVEDADTFDGKSSASVFGFEDAVCDVEKALAEALWTVTGHAGWTIRLRIDAWKADEREIADNEVALVAVELPAARAVRVR